MCIDVSIMTPSAISKRPPSMCYNSAQIPLKFNQGQVDHSSSSRYLISHLDDFSMLRSRFSAFGSVSGEMNKSRFISVSPTNAHINIQVHPQSKGDIL